MNEELEKKVMFWHNKGLSQFGIARKLGIYYWEAQRIVEEQIKKDFTSLFENERRTLRKNDEMLDNFL